MSLDKFLDKKVNAIKNVFPDTPNFSAGSYKNVPYRIAHIKCDCGHVDRGLARYPASDWSCFVYLHYQPSNPGKHVEVEFCSKCLGMVCYLAVSHREEKDLPDASDARLTHLGFTTRT